MYLQKLILSPFVSCILLLMSLVLAPSSDQPTYLGSICRCIFFFHSGCILMEPFTCLSETVPVFPGEKRNPSGIARNGVSTTCYTPRHGVKKLAPARFLRRFLIFFISQKVAPYVFKHIPGSSLDSIQFIFEVGPSRSCCT